MSRGGDRHREPASMRFVDGGQRWAYMPAKREVEGDTEESGGTGEDGFVIYAEESPEDGAFAWTPYKGSAETLVAEHNALFDQWEDLKYPDEGDQQEGLEALVP